MSDNIYQAPQSEVVDQTYNPTDLASRWARLGASILDALFMIIAILPIGFISGFYQAIFAGEQTIGFAYTIAMGLAGLVAFFLINGYFLYASGQTAGKKIVGIKIVDMDGQQMPFGRLIGLRYVPQWVVSYIPIIGNFLIILDALFVFRGDKRCIHDLIAGTQVVKA